MNTINDMLLNGDSPKLDLNEKLLVQANVHSHEFLDSYWSDVAGSTEFPVSEFTFPDYESISTFEAD